MMKIFAAPEMGKLSRRVCLVLSTCLLLATTGYTAQSQTTDSREVQIKKGLEKLKICKRKVKNCVSRGGDNDDINCRDQFESCFEHVYVQYPQVEQYE